MHFRSLFVKDSPDLPEGNLTGRSGGSPLKINPWQPSGVALLQDWVVDLWRPSATPGTRSQAAHIQMDGDSRHKNRETD